VDAVRVAVVTESFLPQVNGVTNSVLRICEQMQARGHEVMVVAPGAGPASYAGARVVRAPSVSMPCYADFQLARPWPQLTATLRSFRPDVVHLASPAVLGAQAAFAARRLDLPLVAVYQTDLAGFARRYGLAGLERGLWRWLRTVHGLAGRTLAPSRAAVEQLREHGVDRVAQWARGVDLQRFDPARRDAQLHSSLGRGRGPADRDLVVGYVGRLAHEKQVSLLSSLQGLPGVRLVVVGDGPQRRQLEQQIPEARFLGQLGGTELATTFASMDVFVHTGAHETFCQAAQEALASGLPVVAPAAGGLLDLVEPERTGLLFSPGCGDDLRRQVARLVADPEARTAMGLAARRSVAGRGWDVLADQLLQHYDEVRAA